LADIKSLDLARLLGISERNLRDLAREGHIVKLKAGQYDLAPSIFKYCARLRAMAARHGGADLSLERARLAKEQADATALKNAVSRREMVPAGDVLTEWRSTLAKVRAGLLALPNRIAGRIPTLTQTDIFEIDAEVRAALTELADDAA
jgi:terminase small subunit / prophage DNA-packing protein